MTPLQRSLKHLKDTGWTVCIVERWISQAKKRVDAFGFGDLLGYHADFQGATLFQPTSGPNMAARRKKIEENCNALGWLQAGNRIVIHAWRKTKPRGQKTAKWSLKEEELNV